VANRAGDPAVRARRFERYRYYALAEPLEGQIRTRGGGCLQADASGGTSAACDKRIDANGDPIGRPVAGQQWSRR